MITIKIPTINTTMVDGKIQTEQKEMLVRVDTSFNAYLKWDEHFRAKHNEDLQSFAKRITVKMGKLKKDEVPEMKDAIELLEFLYCMIDSDQMPTFRDFVRILDIRVAGPIIEKIGQVLEEMSKSVVPPKN